jgi:signal transduction histidine kinase
MESRRFKYNSLKLKISLVITLSVSLILLSKTYINIKISQEVIETDLKDRATEAAIYLNDYLSHFDKIGPNVDLDIFISNLQHDQNDFVKIEVYSLDNNKMEQVASATAKFDLPIDTEFYDTVIKGRKARRFLKEYEGERFWIIIAPVTQGKDMIGLFSVAISLNDADNLIRKQLRIFIPSSIVFIIFLTAILSFILHRAVSRPISRIVAAMERVKGGDLETRAVVHSKDEIGELAKNFNSMVAKIKEEGEKIENFNKELQSKIEEATAELHERNRELLQLTENLFEMQNELSRQETIASMGQLAASVAHEVGTPLHSISGHVQLLLEKENLPSEAVERLHIIQAQIDRLTGIISETLSTTKLPEPEFRAIDLNSVVKDIVGLTQPGLRKKNIEVATELADHLPRVYADQNQLQQVFLNLITNAIDAMPGGGTLKISTAVQNAGPNGKGALRREWRGPEDHNGLVAVAFEDSGIGVAQQDLKNIFKPFVSMKKSRKAAGLGLAICKKIVKEHKGEIEVSSELGHGTMFVIKLPAVSEHELKL